MSDHTEYSSTNNREDCDETHLRVYHTTPFMLIKSLATIHDYLAVILNLYLGHQMYVRIVKLKTLISSHRLHSVELSLIFVQIAKHLTCH